MSYASSPRAPARSAPRAKARERLHKKERTPGWVVTTGSGRYQVFLGAGEFNALDGKSFAENITQDVLERYGIPIWFLRMRSRRELCCSARSELAYLLRLHTPWGYRKIAQWVGGLHHTTVLSGIRAHAKRHDLTFPAKSNLAVSIFRFDGGGNA